MAELNANYHADTNPETFRLDSYDSRLGSICLKIGPLTIYVTREQLEALRQLIEFRLNERGLLTQAMVKEALASR